MRISWVAALFLGVGWVVACSSDSEGDGGKQPSGGEAGEGATGGSSGSGRGGSSQGGAGTGGEDGGDGGVAGSTGGSDPTGGQGAGGGGSGGEGGGDPCAHCSSGACLEDGTCVDCTGNEHCSGSTPVCDPSVNECVRCLPTDDACPDGSYCTDSLTCVPGCKADSCASGRCFSTHDCDHCISDLECAAGRLCATSLCLAPCTGEGQPCGMNRTCCSGRCVDTTRDVAHCGGCGGPSSPYTCAPNEFCGTMGCAEATISRLCQNSSAAIVQDGLAPDDAAGAVVAAALASVCSGLTVRTVSQLQTDVANPTTGQPVAGSGELLMVAGGPFGQQVARWLESNDVAAIHHVFVNELFQFQLTADDSVVTSMPWMNAGPSYDHILFEVVRDTTSGTYAFIMSGFNQSGTTAGAWYFQNVIAPALSTYNKTWYIFEWTDGNGNQAADAGEFVELDSAP